MEDRSKWDFAKRESEIRDSHDLETDLQQSNDFTANLNRISIIMSSGRFSMALLDELQLNGLIDLSI